MPEVFVVGDDVTVKDVSDFGKGIVRISGPIIEIKGEKCTINADVDTASGTSIQEIEADIANIDYRHPPIV